MDMLFVLPYVSFLLYKTGMTKIYLVRIKHTGGPLMLMAIINS